MTGKSDDQGSQGNGTAAIEPRGGEAPGLKGMSGKLGLEVADAPVGVLQIDPNGTVTIVKTNGEATVLTVDTQATLIGLLSGEMSPIVAYLQDRLQVQGDAGLALRVLFGLQAGSPWSAAPRN